MASRPWQPRGPQKQFLVGVEHVYEVLNAGAVGAGKTDCGVMGAVYYKDYRRSPSFAALILRHDEKDLDKHILSLVGRPGYYPRYAGGALNSTELTWKLPSGGRVIFGHAKRLSGLHGPEFQYAYWDELSHWAGTGWSKMLPPVEYLFVGFTRIRSAAGLRCRLRAGTNAYGPGKAWIKWRWGPWLRNGDASLQLAEGAPPALRATRDSLLRLIEQGHIAEPREGQPLVPSGQVLWYHPDGDTETYEAPPKDEDDAKARELLSRSCLVTRTEDNPALAENDPQYALRTRAAGALLHQQLSKSDWDADEPGEGFFKRTWFPVVRKEAVPPLAGVISRLDFAWSRHEKGGAKAERSPWSVRVKVGWTLKHPQFGRRWYILHIVREQGDPTQIMRLIQQTAQVDGRHVPILAPVDFSAGKVVVSDLRNLLEGFQVVEQRERGEKHTRIAALQGPAEGEKIHLVEGEWNEAFLDECARYPRKPDDQLDALAGAYLHVIDQEAQLIDPGRMRDDFQRAATASAQLSSRWDKAEKVM